MNNCPELSLKTTSPLSHAAGINHVFSGGSTNWSTATWTNGAPNSTTVGDRATFALGATGSLTLDTTGVVVGALINSQNTAATIVTLGQGLGTTITLDNTGGVASPVGAADSTAFVGNTSAQAFTVNTNLELANTNLTISQGGTSSLNVGGNITVAAGQTRSLITRPNNTTTGTTFTISGSIGATNPTSTINISHQPAATGSRTANLTGAIGGVVGTASTITISNDAVTGTGGLNLAGPLGESVTTVTQNNPTSGTTLSGNNTNYVGSTILNSGTLTLGNTPTLPAVSSTTVLGGTAATLTINGGNLSSGFFNLNLSTNNPQFWNGDFAFRGINPLSMGTGAVTLGGNRNILVNETAFTVGGVISGAGFGIIKRAGVSATNPGEHWDR